MPAEQVSLLLCRQPQHVYLQGTTPFNMGRLHLCSSRLVHLQVCVSTLTDLAWVECKLCCCCCLDRSGFENARVLMSAVTLHPKDTCMSLHMLTFLRIAGSGQPPEVLCTKLSSCKCYSQRRSMSWRGMQSVTQSTLSTSFVALESQWYTAEYMLDMQNMCQ